MSSISVKKWICVLQREWPHFLLDARLQASIASAHLRPLYTGTIAGIKYNIIRHVVLQSRAKMPAIPVHAYHIFK